MSINLKQPCESGAQLIRTVLNLAYLQEPKNFRLYDLIFTDYMFIFTQQLALGGFEC